MSIKLALVLAIILGVVAAVGANAYLTELEEQHKSEIPTATVAVVRTPLRKGQVIARDRFRSQIGAQEIGRDVLTRGMITTDQVLLYVGKQVNRDLNVGDILLQEFLEDPLSAQTASASVVRKGYRAFTLQVDIVSGVANLIRPNDYVDIIETLEVPVNPESGRVSSRTTQPKSHYLLQTVKILAVDSVTLSGAVRGQKTNYRSVTLELSPNDCLVLAEAVARNRLQLVLRDRDDMATIPTVTNNIATNDSEAS